MKRTITLIAIVLMAIAPMASAELVELAVVTGVAAYAPVTLTTGDVAAGFVPGQYNLAVLVQSDTVDGVDFDFATTGDVVLSATSSASILVAGPGSYLHNTVAGVMAVNGDLGILSDTGVSVYQNLGTSFASGHVVAYNFSVMVGAAGGSINFAAGTQSGAAVHLLGDSATTIVTDSANFQGITFATVPEPMTMGLLGLGGLFLARRKKA